MKKQIVILTLTVLVTALLSGCSALIPRITMDTKNTVPQQTEKSKSVEKCKEGVVIGESGFIVSCKKSACLIQ